MTNYIVSEEELKKFSRVLSIQETAGFLETHKHAELAGSVSKWENPEVLKLLISDLQTNI